MSDTLSRRLCHELSSTALCCTAGSTPLQPPGGSPAGSTLELTSGWHGAGSRKQYDPMLSHVVEPPYDGALVEKVIVGPRYTVRECVKRYVANSTYSWWWDLSSGETSPMQRRHAP
jgi:hypothetical protein